MHRQAGFAVILFFLLFTQAWSEAILILNTPPHPAQTGNNQSGFIARIEKEALRRLGYTLENVQFPAERGLQNANAGIVDGDALRIAGLEKTYPNLIRVNEKIMDWDFVAFSKQDIKIDNGWDSLKPYVVSIINGWKILETNIPKESTLTKVKSANQLFTLLDKNRTDLIIYERYRGLALIRNRHSDDIHVIDPPLETRAMYMYLHKKHKTLVPELVRVLKEMKQDGTYNRIVRESLTLYSGEH
ncbi:MAG TPA: transporter substrate-binding domain-containing protein [Gammaproteobacteria bacterium]|nr:transporter substrate-binding domain-containing protein [Gammaproteobacteria bacterium]